MDFTRTQLRSERKRVGEFLQNFFKKDSLIRIKTKEKTSSEEKVFFKKSPFNIDS